MTTVKITTNNQPRLLLDFNQLTASEQEQVYDVYGQDILDDNFPTDYIRYRGEIYVWGCFESLPLPTGTNPFPDWDGFMSDSFFSGVLVRLCPDDNDRVVMGSYYE